MERADSCAVGVRVVIPRALLRDELEAPLMSLSARGRGVAMPATRGNLLTTLLFVTVHCESNVLIDNPYVICAFGVAVGAAARRPSATNAGVGNGLLPPTPHR